MSRAEINKAKVKSGERGELRVEKLVSEVFPSQYIRGYILRYKGFFREICSSETDFVIVLSNFVYLIEVKNWNTITSYNAKKDTYCVLIHKNSRHIPSPISQNNQHKKRLVELLEINAEDLVCISVICTDDDTEKTMVHSKNVEAEKVCVTTADKLIDVIRGYENRYNRDLDRKKIIKILECSDWSKVPEARDEHKKYVNYINTLPDKVKYESGFYECDKCKSQIVLGQKNGSYFAKCTNFPRCNHKTIPLGELNNYTTRGSLIDRVIWREMPTEFKREDAIISKVVYKVSEDMIKTEEDVFKNSNKKENVNSEEKAYNLDNDIVSYKHVATENAFTKNGDWRTDYKKLKLDKISDIYQKTRRLIARIIDGL